MRTLLAILTLALATISAHSAWNDEHQLKPGEEPGSRKLLAAYIARSSDFAVRDLRKSMDCADTWLVAVITEPVPGLPKPPWWQEGMSEDTGVLVYANGAVHLGATNEATRARMGDNIRMCLLHVTQARDCPQGGRTTRTYYVFDQRTREDWTASDGPQCKDYGMQATLPATIPQRAMPTLEEMLKSEAALPRRKPYDPRDRLHVRGYDKALDCGDTKISYIAPRLGTAGQSAAQVKAEIDAANASGNGAQLGSSLSFANGVYLVDYNVAPELSRSLTGDPVQVCLVYVPKEQDCPPAHPKYGKDLRGRSYLVRNRRTNEAWIGVDSQHMCGGA